MSAGNGEERRTERVTRARQRAERRRAREQALEAGADKPRPEPAEQTDPDSATVGEVRTAARQDSERPTPRARARARPAPPGGRLSDAWAQRIAGGLLLLAGLLAALAIFDLGPFADPPTDEELATEAVESFYSAAATGDWENFCLGLTSFARAQVETNVSRLTGREAEDCIAALSAGANSFEGLEIRVRDVNIVGNEARVETSVKLPDEPPELRSVLLIEEGGEWLVNDPG